MEEALSCFESAATIVEEQNLTGTALEDTYACLVRQLVNQAQKVRPCCTARLLIFTYVAH